jgi:hypothetical protein
MLAMNLIDGLKQEISRCLELVREYNQFPAGSFGAKMIQNGINAAKDVMEAGDTVAMINACVALRWCE